VRAHELREDLAAGADTIFVQGRQRFVDQVEAAGEVELFCVDVEDSREDFAFFVGFHEHVDGACFVRRRVVLMQLTSTVVS